MNNMASKLFKALGDVLFGLCGECSLMKNFIKNHGDSVFILPIRYVDALLRGISQVVFVSNPISGLLILVGLFLGGLNIGLGTIACTTAAIVSALYFRQNSDIIQDGLTQFNGVLVGSVVFSLYPLLYNGRLDIRMWIITVLGGFLSVPLQVALTGFLQGAKADFIMLKAKRERKPFGIPGFTLPFNLTACIILSVLQLYKQEEELNESSVPQEIDLNVSIEYDKLFMGAIKSMGQVYAADTMLGSILMYVGVFIFSPVLAVIEFVGAAVGCLAAAYLSPEHLPNVYAGIWGYCPILTAGAVGGFFVHLTLKSFPAVILAVITTVFVHVALLPFMQVGNLPVFTLPFVLSSWIFLLVSTENKIILRVENPTVPEKNIKLWMKSFRETESFSNGGFTLEENVQNTS